MFLITLGLIYYIRSHKVCWIINNFVNLLHPVFLCPHVLLTCPIVDCCSWSNIKALPGADRLIRHLSSKKVPLALASNSPRSSIESKIASHYGAFDASEKSFMREKCIENFIPMPCFIFLSVLHTQVGKNPFLPLLVVMKSEVESHHLKCEKEHFINHYLLRFC